MATKAPKVSIIIVYYRGSGKLLNALRSLTHSSFRSFEVIVVDNSAEKSVENEVKKVSKKIKYVKSPGNMGYGAGNNLGASVARGKFLFILNPDTEIEPNALESLVKFLDKNKKAAIAAPTLIDKRGKPFPLQGSRMLTPFAGIVVLSFLNKLFPDNPVSKTYWLKDVRRGKALGVDVVPGSAFMIRTSIFEKLGGFDENFFLYFEENDLCKRIRELSGNWRIYMLPEAKVVHHWKPFKKNKRLKQIFAESRFYYFKKHYGVLWALLVEVFARFSKWSATFLAVLLLAFLTRFWKISTFINFGSDIGWFFLSARDFILTGEVPLVGIPSSVPVFRQGAIWTFLLAGALKGSNFNPVGGAVLAALIGVVSIAAMYLLFSWWFGKRVALVSAIVAAASPYLILNDRMPYHTTPIFLTTILLAYTLARAVRGNGAYFFLLGFLLAVLYQLELAAFILLPIVGVIYILERKRVNPQEISWVILGGFAGLLPFIVWDIKTGVYLQTVGFLGWFFLKTIEGVRGIFFSGFAYPAGVELKNYLSTFVFPYSFILSLILFFSSLVYSTYRAAVGKNFYEKFLVLWFFISLTGFLVRGSYSAAYLPLIFLPFIGMLSLFWVWVIKKAGFVGWTLVLAIAGLNLVFVSDYFNNFDERSLTFEKRVQAADFIVSEASGRGYELVYRGDAYQFPAGDSHWRYLLWWRGNEPVQSANLAFAVVERPYELPEGFRLIAEFGKIRVAQKE